MCSVLRLERHGGRRESRSGCGRQPHCAGCTHSAKVVRLGTLGPSGWGCFCSKVPRDGRGDPCGRPMHVRGSGLYPRGSAEGKSAYLRGASMKRRDFLGKSVMGVGAAWLGSRGWAAAMPLVTGKFSATDIVVLGQTGIKTSRLACGTGTMGGDHHSNQTALGIQGLADCFCKDTTRACVSLTRLIPTDHTPTWRRP